MEHFTGQTNLSKDDKPVTVWPLSNSAAPEFSLELSGHTFVKAVCFLKVYILVQITTDTYVNQQLQLLHFQNVV